MTFTISEGLADRATEILDLYRAQNLMIAAAESCTGGLIAASLTEIAGSSDVVDRGFVTYSNEAKNEAIGVDMALIKAHGAVSAEVATAMAAGALTHSRADTAVAVTGIAGPGGGTMPGICNTSSGQNSTTPGKRWFTANAANSGGASANCPGSFVHLPMSGPKGSR